MIGFCAPEILYIEYLSHTIVASTMVKGKANSLLKKQSNITLEHLSWEAKSIQIQNLRLRSLEDISGGKYRTIKLVKVECWTHKPEQYPSSNHYEYWSISKFIKPKQSTLLSHVQLHCLLTESHIFPFLWRTLRYPFWRLHAFILSLSSRLPSWPSPETNFLGTSWWCCGWCLKWVCIIVGCVAGGATVIGGAAADGVEGETSGTVG